MDWIRVDGASMAPFLSPGDWVGVQWAREDEEVRAELGDLVIGPSGAEWLVHRVVSTRPLRTKGDAAFALDELKGGRAWGRVGGVRRASRPGEGGRALRANGLDRWIARFSRLALPSGTWRARIARRIVYGLAWLRRESL
jgi:hypothetical protein